MDDRLTQQQDALIEDALKKTSLAPMPMSITAQVMTRIQKDMRPALFTWNDIVISLVVIVCAGTLLFTFNNLPPMMIMEMRKQSIFFYQYWLVNARWFAPASLLVLAALATVLTMPFLQRQQKR